jgi:aspartate carbamoyltransferase regulatory subunit
MKLLAHVPIMTVNSIHMNALTKIKEYSNFFMECVTIFNCHNSTCGNNLQRHQKHEFSHI